MFLAHRSMGVLASSLALILVASTKAQAQPHFCHVIIDDVGNEVQSILLESEANGEITQVSVPFDLGATGQEIAEKLIAQGGDGYVRTSISVALSPGHVVISMDHAISSAEAASITSSVGSGSLMFDVSGIDSENTPVDVAVDVYRTVTPSDEAMGWVQLGEGELAFLNALPTYEHTHETFQLEENGALPPVDLTGFLMLVGEGTASANTTIIIREIHCDGPGGGPSPDTPVDEAPDFGYHDPYPLPTPSDKPSDPTNSATPDDCGNGDNASPVATATAGPGLHVDVATGDVFTIVPIFRVEAEDPASFAMELRYDSMRSDRTGPLGFGWTHSYNRYVKFERDPNGPADGRVVLYDGTGRRHGFRSHRSGVHGCSGTCTYRCCAQSCESCELCGSCSSECPCMESCGQMCYTSGYELPFGETIILTGGDQLVAGPNRTPITATFPTGERWIFDTCSTITSAIDPRGGEMLFAYSGDKLTTITDKFGRTVQFEYYPNTSLIHKIIHPDQRFTEITYDGGKLTSIKAPKYPEESSAPTTEFLYQIEGDKFLLTQEKLKNGTIFTAEYTGVQGSAQSSSRTIRDSAGNQIVRVESETGFPPTVKHDRPATESIILKDGKNQQWKYARDLFGRITSVQSPNLAPPGESEYHLRTYDYGTSTTNPPKYYPFMKSDFGTDIETRHYTWDNRSAKLATFRDAENNLTTFTHAELGRPALLTRRVSPSGAVRDILYDGTGDVSYVKDSNDLSAGSPHVDRDVVNDYYGTGALGRLAARLRIDRDGRKIKEEYDELGNLKKRIVGFEPAGSADAAEIEYEYDTVDAQMGRPTRTILHRGDRNIVTAFAYDLMGRLTDCFDDDGGDAEAHTSYQYDKHGLLTHITTPGGTTTKYTYDLRNRLKTITEDEGGLNYPTEFTYDLNDNVETITDARAKVSTFEYSPKNFLKRTVDAAGYETLYKRDATGKSTEIDRQRSLGNPTLRDKETRHYDELERLEWRKVAPGTALEATTSFVYDGIPNCGCVATPGSALVHKVTDPDGRITYRYYDWLDRLKKIVRKVGDPDDNGGDSNDAKTTITYYNEALIDEITGPSSEHVKYTYDSHGRRKTVKAFGTTSTDDLVKTLYYDKAGNITQVVRPNDHAVNFTYDGLNRTATVSDSIGTIASAIVYDGNGNLKSWKNALNLYRSFDYDSLDRLEKIYDPVTSMPPAQGTLFTKYEYDRVGNRTAMVDKNQIRTEYEFDELNRLTTTIEDARTSVPSGNDTANTHTVVEYDGADRTTALSDHDGNTTGYVYDALGHLQQTNYPGDTGSGTDHVLTAFTRAGDLDWRLDQNGIYTDYSWNELHQLSSRNYYTGMGGSLRRAETFEFDLSGRLKKAERNQEFRTTVTYDSLGRRKTEKQEALAGDTYSAETTLDYVVDPTSTREIHYPSGRSIVEARDIRDRLSMVTGTEGSFGVGVAWTHDLADRRTLAARPNSIRTITGYDSNDRVTSINHQIYTGGIDPGVIDQREYGYDPAGNRAFSRIVLQADRSELYIHDPRNRLRSMERGELSATGDAIVESLSEGSWPSAQAWEDLDARGNWREFAETPAGGQSQTQSRAVNAGNEYTGISFGSTPLVPEYDSAGNMTFDPLAWNHAAGPAGLRYEYDEENRVRKVRVASSSALLMEIGYDALGRRVDTAEYFDVATNQFLSPPRHTRHIYDGLQTLEERVCTTDSQGCTSWTLAREFIWGDANRFPEPIAMVTHTGSSGPSHVYHYLQDALGSIVGLTDETGLFVERYGYDPYGKTYIEKWNDTTQEWEESTLTGPIAHSAYGNPFAWTGQRLDAVTGGYQFLYRSYSPTLGKWLQRDPIGYVDGVNLYQYVLSAPLFWIDPLGLETLGQLMKRPKFQAVAKELWEKSTPATNPTEHSVWIYYDEEEGFKATEPRRGTRDGVNPGEPPDKAVGHVHTHPAEEHDRHASKQDQQTRPFHKRPGIVIHRANKKDPRKFKMTPFGEGVGKDADVCILALGNPPAGYRWKLTEDNKCKLEKRKEEKKKPVPSTEPACNEEDAGNQKDAG